MKTRLETQAKWRTKRFNKYRNAEMYVRVSRWERSLFAFCKTDFRLLIWFYLSRLDVLLAQWRWSGDNHNCSCPMCRCDSRRHQGNAWKGKPIQERKLIESMECE